MKKMVIGGLFSLVFFAALSVGAQTISGSIGNGSVGKGKTARGRVEMNIPGGLHVNSNRPNSKYAVATVVRVSTTGGARVGGITYPRGRTRKFTFSETPISVYEGRVSFLFTLTVPANFSGNSVRVSVSVRSQACTDEVCYAPKTQTTTLTAKVK